MGKRDDNGPGFVYILRSDQLSATRGRQTYKFGFSRNVERRIRHLNQPEHYTLKGRRAGAYGGVTDWVLVRYWPVMKMRAFEQRLRTELSAINARASAGDGQARPTELFHLDDVSPEDFVSFLWEYGGNLVLRQADRFAKTHEDWEELELSFDSAEQLEEEDERVRLSDELARDLDAEAELYGFSRDGGWFYSDSDERDTR